MRATSDPLPTPTPANTLVAVMSFNMDESLRHAVESVARHFPGARIVVYDDASTSKATRRILDGIARQHEVVVAEHPPSGSALGGLHANMNMALDRAEADGLDYVFFVQDDQQVVRPLDAAWADRVKAIFDLDASIMQVVPMFAMGWRGDEYYEREFSLHSSGHCYEGRRSELDGGFLNPSMWGICDNGVVSVARLRTHQFRYDAVEWVGMDRSAAMGLRYVNDAIPSVMFVPWPRTHRRRGHVRSTWQAHVARLLVRLNERGVGAGRARLEDMTVDATRRLLERDPALIPYAEDYLTTDRPVRRPWYYRQCFDRKKLRGRHLLTLRWIFDGPDEYITARRTARIHAGEPTAPRPTRAVKRVLKRVVWTIRQGSLFVRQPWRGRARELRRDQDIAALTAAVPRLVQLRNVVRSMAGAPPKGRQEVWALTMVRNEADIIGYTVRHLLAQGVDQVVVADNLSDDDTPAVLASLAEDPRVIVIQDRMKAHYQGDKMSRLARGATRAGAAWIVPFDADEAWYPATGEPLGEYLRSCREDVVKGYLENYLPAADTDDPNPYLRFQHREVAPGEHKVAFRVNFVSRIWSGNHAVSHPGQVTRGLRIAHVPYRSLAQMQAKVRGGREALVAATDLDEALGAHWRELGALDDGATEEAFAKLLAGSDVVHDPIPYAD